MHSQALYLYTYIHVYIGYKLGNRTLNYTATAHTIFPPLNLIGGLQRRVGINHKTFNKSVEPTTCLRSWNISIRADAIHVEPLGGRITSTVRLTTGLNPDERVDNALAGISGGTDSKPIPSRIISL